ncbi:MAG TPA: FAD-binding oxidoreductase [Sphingomicrobium sp.]|nr:FAD-binding oxidoreductase [Sphingomicrobium sp.]
MPANKGQEPTWGIADPNAFGPLRRDAKVDVVVIGAGFVGLAAALKLAANGREVAVLGASGIGASGSAISAGHVGPMLYGARKGPEDIVKVLGSEMGRRLNERVALAGSLLFDTIAQHKISCAHRRGYVGVYRSSRSLDRAARRFETWARFGGRARPLSASEVRDRMASDRYAGGFLLEDGGWVDPLRLLAGLARAASDGGVAIHTSSPVVSAVREGNRWVVRTDSDTSVLAKDVILATGASTPAFAGLGIADSTIQLPCAIAATAPDQSRFRQMLPEGGPVADFDDPAVFAPVIDDRGRLLVSALIRDSGANARSALAPARNRLKAVFGEDVQFSTFDAGVIPITLDGLPNIIRRDDGLIAITGCNGFGLTLGMIAAREAAELVLGTPADQLALPVKAPKAIRGASLMSSMIRNIVVPLANRFGK